MNSADGSRLGIARPLPQKADFLLRDRMRDVKRRLFNVLAALSLLLFVVASGWWVLSYRSGVDRRLFQIDTPQGSRSLDFYVSRGRFFCRLRSNFVSPIKGPSYRSGNTAVAAFEGQYPASIRFSFANVGLYHGPFFDSGRDHIVWFAGYEWYLSAPFWMPVVLFAVLPAVWIRLAYARWRRRTDPGCCVICGYDLRATPERCPECGTVPSAPAVQSVA
jgi:hypothetical protein